MLIQKLISFARNWKQDLRARISKRLVLNQVIKVLANTHAQELAITPRNDWALVRQKQIEEIQAVRSGQQFDIVDRRTWAYPYLPEALHRLNQPVLKNTPYNLRRFGETPIPRRAMNIVKNAVLSFRWKVQPIKDYAEDVDPEMEQRIRIVTETFKRPNNTGESFRDLLEQGLDDFMHNGQAAFEHRTTPYVKRPLKYWAVDSSTIRIFLDWTESTPDRPRYAQMTGLKGERGIVTFLNDELIFIRDNIRTATPFGLGRLEVAFNSVNAFLGVQDMSARAGSDQVHKTWLWWEQSVNPAHLNMLRRQITNEVEGQAKLNMIAGMKAPTPIEVKPVTPDDLLLDWQKFLIQIIAAAFDLSPQALNMDDHPNRSTAQVMADSDWKTCVVPVATRFQQAFTDEIQGEKGFNFKDLEFVYEDLDEPDLMTRTVISQRLWSMSAIKIDEIRKKFSLPPLAGPFGKLTMFQQQLVLAEVQAMLGGRTSGSSSSSSMGMGGGSGSGGMSSGSLGTGMGGGSMTFSAQDVAGLQPDEVQMYRDLGLLPEDIDSLTQGMEEEQPGILDQISDELSEYFKKEIATKEADEVLPAEVTPQQRQEQVAKYMQDQHQESLAEIVINRRGVFGPATNSQVRKNPLRGKYPRTSGGGFVDPNKDRVIDQNIAESPINTGKPKKNYRKGQNNNAY